MSPERFGAIIGFIGIVAELGGALLLAALFFFLRPQAFRRRYFSTWTWAWVALSVGIAALAIRYSILVTAPQLVLYDVAPEARALYFIYQFFKILFYALLVAGTLWYVRGRVSGWLLRRVVIAIGVVAAVTVGLSPGLSEMVAWQSPVAVAAFGGSGWLLLRLPPSRRSVGSAATGVFFLMLAGLWLGYLFAFGLYRQLYGTQLSPALGFMLRFNSYFDLLFHMLLGYGMVLLLMEDRKREVDDVYAELAVAHDALRRASLLDALTGALNRRAFSEAVGLESAHAAVGAVVMVDLDNLKSVNDAYGHAAGDELLRKTAEALRAALRAADKLYRWGGDEFLLVLPEGKAEDVRRRIAALMAAAAPVALGDGRAQVPIQLSVGAADYRGAERMRAAIEHADREMYEEKERHRLVRAAAGYGQG